MTTEDLENKTKRAQIVREFAELINRNSLEQTCNTPDFIIAECLVRQLEILSSFNKERREWYAQSSMPEKQSQANKDKPHFKL